VFSVSLWCLFRTPMSSFICSCVFSHFIFGVLEFLVFLWYVLVDHVK
jgi:hypothetical protein